ncbi:hypothetical protein DFQ04_3083 [Algoriphagus boseongensis]|uniref:GYF domain-containing protein n=1 Tax=Algoriphagus boseongensis TaxID=1442587 RepID=A0A4R6T664_9BACT|nr:DUF4339 domain-containing protein [Algoriphagus boseongensis]TDQ15197.1 hypothetical protein DFQ04_3083 [Algoriphagus boseongensis]
MKKYFYTDGVTKFGPYSIEELLDKNISRDTKVWFYGLATWTPINEIEELKEVVSKIPPPIHIPVGPPPLDFIEHFSPELLPEEKSKYKQADIFVIIFIIVCILIGMFVMYLDKKNEVSDLYEKVLMDSFDGDEDFSLYLDKFYRDLNVFGIYPKKPSNVTIKFARLDQITNTTHIHAMSYGGDNDDLIEIYINPSSWDKFNKPKRHYLMYHELAHDILNLDDLPGIEANKGKLMYPAIESYERITMDEFIEAYQELFEEVASE